jgi:hypothetical protein
MGRAGEDTAGGQALAAKTKTDPATLERVRAVLLDQLSGVRPLVQRERPRKPGATAMDRRTCTRLYRARAS